MKNIKNIIPGFSLVFIISIIANYLGDKFPIIGSPVFGILIGIIINNIWEKPNGTIEGINFTSKKILQWSVIVLGAGLSFNQVRQTGLESLSITLITIFVALATAYIFGKFMNIPKKMTTLIGVGTAICGGSAIGAVSPIIEADEVDIAYSISTIFLFNIIAVLIFPPLGHFIGFSDKAFGLWAGTAINDTSSVVAAGYAFSNIAGEYATIVKLTRATMIIPISFIFAIIMSYKKKKQASLKGQVNYSLFKVFPWFILWFMAASILNTLGLFKSININYINYLGKFMIVLALTAVGLSANFKKMITSGIKPIILGIIVWFNVALVSILMQLFLGII